MKRFEPNSSWVGLGINMGITEIMIIPNSSRLRVDETYSSS